MRYPEDATWMKCLLVPHRECVQSPQVWGVWQCGEAVAVQP